MPKGYRRDEKLALARQMLRDGYTGYAINKECCRRFGSGLVNGTEALKAELARTQHPHSPDPGAVTAVTLPPEMLTEEADQSPTAPDQVSAPALNGALLHLRHIQSWMAKVQAEQVILTKDGKVSILAWHNFTLEEGPHA